MKPCRKAIPVLLTVFIFLSLAAVGCKTQAGTLSAAALSGTGSSASGTESSADPERADSKASPASSSANSEADSSCLDGAVFIGDSVTLKLKNYVTIKRKNAPAFFGKARFLAAGSMGSGNALKPLSKDSIHPYYNGEKALLEDSVAKMGADKIYIMLGMNDIAIYGIDGAAENLETLALKIQKKSPNAQFYIQSVTPILMSKQKKMLNNRNLEIYNEKLKGICKKQNWQFIDLASAVRNTDGSLKPEYCSDPDDLGVHFTDKACEVWIHCVLSHINS